MGSIAKKGLKRRKKLYILSRMNLVKKISASFSVLIFFILILTTISSVEASLKNRLTKGNVGDYVVTEQGSHYSLLFVRKNTERWLVLEEIMINKSQVNLKKFDWKKWVNERAPGATSWLSLTIDLEKNTLAQCFSYLEKQWLFIEKSDYLLANLLTLHLRPTKEKDRKRVGPAPFPGEVDRRKVWIPPLVRDGKKIKKPQFEVVRTTWPSDKTRLAGCILELYLDKGNPDFPFPYWMEVQSPHYTFKIRAIDSGTQISSPMPLLK